jgi:glycosyltransferase involved in cell wall biosynthesis
LSTTAPLVSIVIPSLNQGKFIEQTIESVLAQDYRPLEILVIDAGSTDNTLEVLHKYDFVPEIIWTSEPDHGHADGINKGFSRASGEVVAWLNADDVYYSCDVIDTVVTFFAKKPQVDIFYGDVAVISKENILLRLVLLPSYNVKRIERGNYIFQPAAFFHKRVVEKEKLDENQIGLDYEYWLRLAKKGYIFQHTNKILACDRHYPERLSVIQKTLIDSQIANLKAILGLSRIRARFMHPVDRLFQAACRISGLIILFRMYLSQSKPNTAFPLRIDSYPKLLWRQLTKAIGSDFKILTKYDL